MTQFVVIAMCMPSCRLMYVPTYKQVRTGKDGGYWHSPRYVYGCHGMALEYIGTRLDRRDADQLSPQWRLS